MDPVIYDDEAMPADDTSSTTGGVTEAITSAIAGTLGSVVKNGTGVASGWTGVRSNKSEAMVVDRAVEYVDPLFCGSWEEVNKPLFGVGNLLILISLIALFTRPSLKWHLFERFFLTAGCFVLSVWAWRDHCAPDITVWNLLFGIMHGYYVIELLFRMRPVRYFGPDQELIRRSLFPTAPLHAFERLMDLAVVETFDRGSEIMIHGRDHLRLIVSGHIQAVSEHRVLYHAKEKQFADSLNRLGYVNFPVMLTVVRSVRFIKWDSEALHDISRDEELKPMLSEVVSKDAAAKLLTFLNSICAVVTPPVLNPPD